MKNSCGCCLMVACFMLVVLSQISGGKSECSGWCVANEVPDAVIQKSLDWVCVNAKEACDRIQPGQPCYKPNNLRAVASAAFNDYWQTVKHAPGAKCQIYGAAILVDIDPSFDDCKFSCTP